MTSDERFVRWMKAGLLKRGVPPEARLTMGFAEDFLHPTTRLTLVWVVDDMPHRVVVEEPQFPLRRGWVGWPVYRAGARLLRALG